MAVLPGVQRVEFFDQRGRAIAFDFGGVDRDDLPSGFAADGPAILVEATTSTPVPPGWRLEVMASGAIILTRSEG